MNQEYLRNLYKDYELFPREGYRACSLPEPAKQILCETGLPELEFFLEFYTQENQPVLLSQFHESFDVEGLGDMVLIGEEEYGMPLCINREGEVVIADGDCGGIRFVNSSLEGLLECIAVYLAYAKKMDAEETDPFKTMEELDEVRAALTNEIREKFQEIDARALGQEEGWWDFLLEELESGAI